MSTSSTVSAANSTNAATWWRKANVALMQKLPFGGSGDGSLRLDLQALHDAVPVVALAANEFGNGARCARIAYRESEAHQPVPVFLVPHHFVHLLVHALDKFSGCARGRHQHA